MRRTLLGMTAIALALLALGIARELVGRGSVLYNATLMFGNWAHALDPERPVVVACKAGHEVSQTAVAQLRAALSPPAAATANAPPGTGSLGAARIRLGWATKRPQSIDACAAVARMAHRCACDCAVARSMGSMPRH